MTDDDQVAAFPDLPPVRERPESWVCSRCGNDVFGRVHLDKTRPSLDPRYAIGMCDDCGPARKGVKGETRPRVQIVRASAWSREMWVAAQERKAEDALLQRYRRGHNLSDAEVAQVRAYIVRLDAERHG